MDSPRRQRSISLCQPHSTTPHPSRVGVPTRLPDALGCRPSTARGQGATLPTFPLVPLTREPTCTQAIDPRISRSTLTPADTSRPSLSSGYFPDFPWSGSPWLTHRSPLHCDWFPKLMGLLLGAFGLPVHPMSPSSLPHPGTGPFPASHGLPTPSGRCAALATRPSPPRPLVPSSRVYTPPGRQQPCGAGQLDRLLSGDRFVRLARVAPFPPSSLSPVLRPRPNPLGCRVAPSDPSSRVYTPLGRQQLCGAGPLDPHPSGDRLVRLAPVAPLPTVFPVPRPRPNPLGCCVAPSHPSSRVCTPPGCQQPCGAGPLDPHPYGDRFVRLARVAPLPPPPPSLLCRLPCCLSPLGPSRGPSHTPFSVPSPCAAARCCGVCAFFFAALFSPWFPPPCMHAQQHCIAICLGSVQCSHPVPPPSCGAALGGPRPCQLGAPPSRPCLLARVVVRVSSFSPLHPPLPSVSCPPS